MRWHIAKDGERLESIFYAYHGVNDHRYREFCEKNVKLLPKDRLDSGDRVVLLDAIETQNISSSRRIVLWE